jgi:hypothetical protein
MKYDKEHIDIIIEKISEGHGRVNACKAAGINYQTFINWMERELEFLEAVKNAERVGADKIKDLAQLAIRSKFDKQWTAAAWWLERNYPNEYKNRTDVSVDTKGTHINVIFKKPVLD